MKRPTTRPLPVGIAAPAIRAARVAHGQSATARPGFSPWAPNRAAELTPDDKAKILTAAATPDTTNPVADRGARGDTNDRGTGVGGLCKTGTISTFSRAATACVTPQKGTDMAKKRKTIITCAVTGAIHTPTMSEHLPITPDEIAEQAVAAAEAGASILHLHARDPQTGAPSVNLDDFTAFLPRIKQATGAVLNISTGGSLHLAIQDRLKPAATFSPEMCSMNMVL